MNRFGLCLFTALLSCSAALVAGAKENIAKNLSQATEQDNTNYRQKYAQVKSEFDDVRKARDYADYSLSCQAQKLAHVIAFNDFHKKALEKRTNELAQKSDTQNKMIEEKNKQVSLLFSEISTIRSMLNDSLSARNRLEKAYLTLDKKFQTTQQNFLTKNKQLKDKIIEADVTRQVSLMGESKAAQQVALLTQALKDNEKFYTEDVNKIFDELAHELETTRSQLALATDACYETEHEANMLRQQLEMTQKVLSKQGLSAKTEKDLKEIQLAINKLGKQTTTGQSSYHQQLSQALDQIQKLDRKLDKTEQELAKSALELQHKIATEGKSQQEIKMLSSELSRMKREYQSTLAQTHLESTRTMQSLESELNKTKHSFERARKTLEAKDLAFGMLEKHCKDLQTVLNKEQSAQKTLVENLHAKEALLKTTQAKLARSEQSERTLRNLTKHAQAELAQEMATTQALGEKLQSVSQKLASTEMAKNSLLKQTQELSLQATELGSKLQESERQAFALKTERDVYMSERHAFAHAAERLAMERDAFADKLDTVVKTVSTAHYKAKRGINDQFPNGVAIV